MWLVLFLAILVPGLCVASWKYKQDMAFLLAVPFSLLLYTVIAVSFLALGLTQWVFSIYLTTTVLIVLATLVQQSCRNQFIELLVDGRHFWLIFILIVIYHGVVGAFVDHGVDLFRHMSYTQKAMNHNISSNSELMINFTLGTENRLFHNIAAWFAVKTGTPGAALIETVSLVYSSLWTLSVYFFCRMVLNLVGVPKNQITRYAFIAVFFYWTTFGINNFSFPRYYVGGPVVLNYGIYLSAFALLLHQFARGFSIANSVVIAMLLAVTGFIHQQEALLFIAFSMSLSVVILLHWLFRSTRLKDVQLSTVNLMVSALILVASVIGVLLAIYLLPKYKFDPVPLRNLGLLSERLIAWNILRPNHQFFTVLGLWGFYVLFISLLYFKQVSKSAVLCASLLLPLITVFNPVFAEAYMKLAYPRVLWRVLLAMQLPLLATYIIWQVVANIRNNKFIRGATFLSLVPLFVLLLPFQVGPLNNLMVKTPSLIKTPKANSYRHWNDMLDYLNSLDQNKHILTDPVTGYAIRAITPHKHFGIKFFKRRYSEFNFESYENNPLAKYTGRLLIINRRNGDINHRLKRPYHVYPDIMYVDKYYGEALLQEVKSKPEMYEKMWSQNNIDIYLIR